MQPIVSFRVSPEEFQSIEAEAAAAGLKRADYVRAKVIAPDHRRRIQELEQQVDELTQRLSKAEQDCVELERLALRLQQRLQETEPEQQSSFWNKLTRNLSNR
jgi:small-conductance mechanosensitive channel